MNLESLEASHQSREGPLWASSFINYVQGGMNELCFKKMAIIKPFLKPFHSGLIKIVDTQSLQIIILWKNTSIAGYCENSEIVVNLG